MTLAGTSKFMHTPKSAQVAVTVASGGHAERLDKTFTSFRQNPFLELHAFIIGERLPERRVPGIVYHLERPDPAFGHPMRDLYYRRFLFLDQLEVDYAVVVDNSDVLCLRPIPEIPRLLRGAALGACVEHAGARYLAGQGYTSNYLNAGVTFWDVRASRAIREQIVRRGRARFRSVEDQLSLNEVVNTLYYDELAILPCQYNYRALLAPRKYPGWPTVDGLDGVLIYHCALCVEAAKQRPAFRPTAILPELVPDAAPPSAWRQFWRRLAHRFLDRHRVG